MESIQGGATGSSFDGLSMEHYQIIIGYAAVNVTNIRTRNIRI
jgi:hypothetical protein